MSRPASSLRAAFLVICILFSAILAQAQYRAGVQGVVQDEQGAVVADANVTVTAQDTGLSQQTTTTANGDYSIVRLAPGLYTITADKAGFRKNIVKDVNVGAEQVSSVNLTLKIGASTESVTVNGGDRPDIDTESGTISGTVTAKEIENLPSVGRDPFQLLRLAPGVFGDGASGNAGGGQALPGQNQGPSNPQSSIFMTENQPSVVAAGTRNNGNSFQIDGVQVNSLTWGGSTLITPNEESIKEVQIQANPYSAENGRGAGAQVLAVSKSGTNDFHGSFFFKIHRPGLDAYQRWGGPNFAAPNRDAYRFNQYGGSIGGPVIKNRLFAFFSYERQPVGGSSPATGWYVTSQFYQAVIAANPNSIASSWAGLKGNIPTNAVINTGNTCTTAGLTETVDCLTLPTGLNIGSPMTTGLGTFDPTYGQAGTPYGIGNGLDPNTPDVVNLTTQNPQNNLAQQYNLRVDFQATHNDLVTFSLYRTPNNATSYNGAAIAANLWHSDRLNFSTAVIWNHTFNANLLNEARFNVTRWHFNELQTNPQMLFGFPADNINGAANISFPEFGPPGPGIFYQTSYNFRDNLTKVHGSHLMKFGVDTYKDQVEDVAIWAGLPPSYQFDNLWDWANDAPFQEGGTFDPRTGVPTGSKKYIRSSILALFAQDDWKARPNLTLNLGLRWEYFGPVHEKYGNLGVPILGPGSNALTDLVVRTNTNGYNAQKNGFGPQLGFAWSPQSFLGHDFSNRFVVRGGIGLSYTRPQEAITLNGRLNPPVVASFTFQSKNDQVYYAPSSSTSNIFGFPANPAAVLQFGSNGLPTCAPATCAPVNLTAFDNHLATPRSWKYSVEGEYDFGDHWIGSAGYLGSRSSHFFRQINNLNWLYPNGLNPAINSVDLYTNDASGYYNALNLELKRQVGQLSWDAQYTYSHCYDHGSQDYYSDPYPFSVEASKGACDYDATHSFKAYSTWTPRFFHGNGWQEKALGGWALSGIYTWHTGFPWTPVFNNIHYNAGDPNNLCSMIYVDSGFCQAEAAAYLGHAGQNYANGTFQQAYGNFPQLATADGSTGSNLYFAVPTFGSNGMPSAPGLPRNYFRGPHYHDFDITIGKEFGLPPIKGLGENAKLAIHAYIWNLFNTLNLQPLGSTQAVDSSMTVDPTTGQISQFSPNPQFGQAQGALGARVVEFQARFSF